MSEFTASNGVKVDQHGDDLSVSCIAVGSHAFAPVESQALREFFQHERDAELGRWRWPENPDVCVHMYSREDGIVLHERTVETYTFDRAAIENLRNVEPVSDFARAARAYFDTHPEPKPWHNAEPGEVWVLDADYVFSGAYLVEVSKKYEGGIGFRSVLNALRGPGLRAPVIRSARRIWPEATS